MNDSNAQKVVEHLLNRVLQHQFAPSPQRVGKQFRRVHSLNYGPGPGESAIAFPFGLAGAIPLANLGSIQDSFLAGRDAGVAISGSYLERAVQPVLDGIVGLQRDLHVHGDAGWAGGLEIDYRRERARRPRSKRCATRATAGGTSTARWRVWLV